MAEKIGMMMMVTVVVREREGGPGSGVGVGGVVGPAEAGEETGPGEGISIFLARVKWDCDPTSHHGADSYNKCACSYCKLGGHGDLRS